MTLGEPRGRGEWLCWPVHVRSGVMSRGTRVLVADAPATRLGELVLAGEVVEDEPVMPSPLRVLPDYVVSVVLSGHGTYRHSDGRESAIGPGAITVTHPHQPHWYGTPPGGRWTELFAVFNGPLFHTFAAAGILPNDGPRYPRPAPSPETLGTALRATPATTAAAEHQLLALASWLADAAPPAEPDGLSQPIAAAVERLNGDLASRLDMRAVAAEVGLPYDTFRRRFTAQLGRSPLAYRNDRRLRAAANLLRSTDMTVREIARTLGFADEFHLSRRFRARFGKPPSTYRGG